MYFFNTKNNICDFTKIAENSKIKMNILLLRYKGLYTRPNILCVMVDLMKKIISYILSVLLLFTMYLSADAVSSEKSSVILADDGVWKYSVTGESNAEITGYLGTEKIVSIPDKIDEYTVTSIGSAAFYNSDIVKITLSSSIDSIGWWAFYGCKNLSFVELNDGLNTIEYGAFMNCRKLKNIALPYTVFSVGEDAFGVSCSTIKNINDHYSKKTVSKQTYSYDKNFTVKGYEGTFAEKYAQNHNLSFESISDILFCDADSNGTVDYNDIILLKKYTDGKQKLSESQIRNCDVDGDTLVTPSDISLILKYVMNEIPQSELPVAKNIESRTDFLYGKTMYCDGDSVAKGTGTNILGSDFYSYCNYITDTYNMTSVNKSVGGTTIAKQKNKNSPGNKSILERVREMKGSYDIVLLEGGFNDLFQKIKIGEVTDINDKSGNYNESTTAGALESICYFLNENYADSVKLFVLCHTRNENPNQYLYWNTITDVLKKWNIAYVDISSETDFCDINDEITTQYFMYNKEKKKGDGIHPLAYAAKKIYGPVIADKLNELFLKKVNVSFDDESIELGLGESFFQSPVISEQYEGYSARWSSDNPSVATVNSNGEVIAREMGRTMIRYCTNDGITASYSVSVKFMAMDLVLDSTKLNLKCGQTHTIGTSFLNGTTAYHISFSSSDSSVVEVSPDKGIITAVGSGKSVITCRTPSGVVAQCTVTVK